MHDQVHAEEQICVPQRSFEQRGLREGHMEELHDLFIHGQVGVREGRPETVVPI